MTKLEHALILAKRGFKVFPLKENDKRPLKAGKFSNQASNSLDRVKSMWTTCPNSNIGIATGDGLTVIDVDTLKHGKNDGESSLLDYEKQHGLLKDTFEVKTPTGGRHLYYFTDQPYKNKEALLPGVDVRGVGGYVVAPGSVINGEYYEIVNPKTPERADSIVNGLLNTCKTEIETDAFEVLERGYTDNLIKEGGRTSYLVSQIGQLCDGTKSIDTIKSLIRVLNENNLEVPLSEYELETEVFPAIKRFKKHEAKTVNKELLRDPKKIKLVSVDSIKKEAVKWLVPGYIPEGAITIIGGDGGLGKTTLWCNIASGVSRGKPCILQEDDELIPAYGKVIYFSGEDDTARVLRSKLESNEANLSNISTIPLDDEVFSDISIGGELLEGLIEEYKPKLVIFDPIQQFIKNTDMSKRNDMRQTLTSLTRLGKLYGTTFILVMHTNKRDKVGSFRDKLSDSADLWDISRSVLAVGRNEDGENFITHEKSSYCMRKPAVIYHIERGAILRDRFENDRMTYVEFMNGKAKANKADEKQQLKAVYLELIKNSDNVIKKDVEDSLLKMGYSKNMIRTVYTELINERSIIMDKTSNGKGIITYLSSSENLLM